MKLSDQIDKPLPEAAIHLCTMCKEQFGSTRTICPYDGTALISVALPDSSLTKNYLFEDIIGAGGMGVIYKAQHKASKRLVVLKMLHARMASEQAILRFHREGKLLEMLSSDPGIVSIRFLDVSESGHPFMVMDFIDGVSLNDVLANEGPLTTPRFLSIFKQICRSLSYAHKCGIVHRDIKPANIMLVNEETGHDVTKLLDFGIAKLLSDPRSNKHVITKPGDTIGSPLYISPEQARGELIDERTDIYSLGCTMYESLTGAPPFLGNTSFETMLLHLNQQPEPMSIKSASASERSAHHDRKIDSNLEAIIMRTLAKDPGQRPYSMHALLNELENFEKSAEMGALSRSTPRTINRRDEQKSGRKKSASSSESAGESSLTNSFANAISGSIQKIAQLFKR